MLPNRSGKVAPVPEDSPGRRCGRATAEVGPAPWTLFGTSIDGVLPPPLLDRLPTALPTSYHSRPRVTTIRPSSGFVVDGSYYVWDARYGFVELRDRIAEEGNACAVTGRRIPRGSHYLGSVCTAYALRISYRGFVAVQHERPLV